MFFNLKSLQLEMHPCILIRLITVKKKTQLKQLQIHAQSETKGQFVR